jgi:predicted ATPase
LEKAWREIEQGYRRVVLISAEAGGGKTRLVQEWARSLPGDAFFYGPCYESTRTLAYQPWLALLEQLYERIETAELDRLPALSLDALARLLPTLAERQIPAVSGEQNQLFAAVHALLRLADQPLALFLDDLQWADAASLALLHFLAVQRLTPLLFVGAYRSEEMEDNPALLALLRDWRGQPDMVTLPLEPLTAESVAQLMRRLWPQLPPGFREPHLRDRLVQATGGNPLFVNEIVRELAGTSQLPAELPVPPSLRELIQRRLRELPSSGRQVLDSLAILDQPAEFDLARRISGRREEETIAALEVGLRRRLLSSTTDSPPLLDFSHDLMGQAVREQLSPIRKQLLHRRTAVALSGQGAKAAQLAYHWGRAGDREQERIHAAQAGFDSAAL